MIFLSAGIQLKVLIITRSHLTGILLLFLQPVPTLLARNSMTNTSKFIVNNLLITSRFHCRSLLFVSFSRWKM